MDKRKLALLILLSILLVFFASLTAMEAGRLLGAGYEVAGEGVSFVVLLAFLTYADAELVLFLREKFEGESKERLSRGIVLIYLLMFLLLILIGIIYFGSKSDVDLQGETLREDGTLSIPPEVEEDDILPQILIEEEEEPERVEEVETVIIEEEEPQVPEEEESMEEVIAVKEEEKMEIRIPTTPTFKAPTSQLYEVLPPTMPEVSVKSQEVREIPVPSVPEFAYEPFAYLEEEELSEEDFWATFYIAGEDDLSLLDGIYYMDLYVNNTLTGSITVNVVNEVVSLNREELKEYIGGTITDEFYSSVFSNTSEYLSLDYLESLGVKTSYDAITYEVRLTFSPDVMPIQILSIGGTSVFRRSTKPITGGIDLEPAAFTLTSSYYLSLRSYNLRSKNFMRNLYFSFSSSNTARLYDVYLDFNYYLNLNASSLRFNLGSYRFHYDLNDALIRLSWGNVSSDLFSPMGSSVGIRFDRSYAYAPYGYRRPSQIEEVIVVDTPSEITIYNEGREVFRRTLDIGTYRLRDFILYTGANKITIVQSPLDGTEEKVIELDVLYAASLLAPGEMYYGASLVTGRRIISKDTSTLSGTIKLPLPNDRMLAYDVRDLVLSGYLRAGLTTNLTMDSTLAFQNSPTEEALFRPNMKLALEFTHANILGTTRYGLNVTERTEESGSWNIPGLYANIGHQIRTGWNPLSSISLSATYSSPEEQGVENRHRFGISTSLSGYIGILNWNLSGSTGLYTDDVSSSYWSASTSLSASLSSSLWLSASLTASGNFSSPASVSGRIYATYRFNGGSVNASYNGYDTSITSRYSKGRHSLSAGVDISDYTVLDGYSFDASYGYSGDYVNLGFGLTADRSFENIGASITMRSASVFADGLFTFSSYIPSNYVLITQSGALKGNSVSVGSAGYSRMSELPRVFGVSMYDGLSLSNADSFIVYSQGDDSFSTSASFPVNIPASRRAGYILNLNADNTYSSSALIVLPDGTPWINGSSPVYSVKESDGIKSIEMTDYYLFTDQDGRFVTSAMAPGEYAFDVPYGNEWILVTFTVEDRADDIGMLQMLSQGELQNAEINPDIYTYEMELTLTSLMTEDAFFDMVYAMEVAA